MKETKAEKAEIGVFGGSGFYSLENAREVEVDTPYGKPSAPIALAEIGGKRVAFLPRHGKNHEFPPHKINYRANLWAFKQLGVTRVIAPCAAGSLARDVKPGDFVVCDQLANFTNGRANTFFDGPKTVHVSLADSYCPELRKIAVRVARAQGIRVHDGGTVVVIQGPHFATRAESAFFQRQGWTVINMTQYPEAALAREAELCYANISLITDYDVGIEGVPPVSHAEVLRVFQENNERLRKLLFELIKEIPGSRGRACACGTALKEAGG